MFKLQYTTAITGCQVLFSWEGESSCDLAFRKGGCTRVGVPYIYMCGGRVACRGEFFARSILLGWMEWLDQEKCFGAIEPLSQKKSDRLKVEIPAEHSGISGTCVCVTPV